jgi:adenylosuccinate synthase
MSRYSGATVVFGGQAGSEGKGAIVGYLARKRKFHAAICSFMTNAGHTWIGDNGEKVMVQQLPMSVVGPDVDKLLIGPGGAITPLQLEKELNDLDARGFMASERLRIHPRAMIIEQEDINYEKDATKYLASTSKGCGRALARKVMRSNGNMESIDQLAVPVRLAREVSWMRPFIQDTTVIVNDIINQGGSVMVEGSQGFDLDIHHGISYPYCTSRGCTPQQTLADCGISERLAPEVIAVLRSYPIRVGNIVEDGEEVGNSGPFGGKELTWEEVTKRSGYPTPLEERTTVTGRVRRIFEMDFARLEYMVNVCRPTVFALTFADYIDHELAGLNTQRYHAKLRERLVDKDPDRWTPTKLFDFLNKLDETGVLTGMVKTGAKNGDMIDFEQEQEEISAALD